jgi:DNA-binding IclR family transcriptional regulator
LLLILEAMAEAGPLGITQKALADRLEVSEATISRAVSVLEQFGYAEETAKGVRLGRRCGELWRAYRRGLKLTIHEAEAALRATAVEEEPEE